MSTVRLPRSQIGHRRRGIWGSSIPSRAVFSKADPSKRRGKHGRTIHKLRETRFLQPCHNVCISVFVYVSDTPSDTLFESGRLTSPGPDVSSRGDSLGIGLNMDMWDPATVGTASASQERISRVTLPMRGLRSPASRTRRLKRLVA